MFCECYLHLSNFEVLFGGLSVTIPSWKMSFVRKHVSVVPVHMVKMKRQRTMLSFLSVSDGKKSRMETVTGKSNFSGKQISSMQATRNRLLHRTFPPKESD